MSAQGSRSQVSYQEETTWGVNPAGTAGTQNVSFTISKVAGDPSGLANDSTVYTATINPDAGGAQAIAVVGSEAQTMGTVVDQINQDLTGASAAVIAGGILVTSDTLGASSSIAISDTDLFLTLTNFSAVDAAVPGTGSGAADFDELPHTSFAINLTKDIYQDDTIRGDRLRQFNIHGNRIVGGDIAANFAHGGFDSWLESACYGAWAADVLDVGTTEKSFTVEQGSLDINQYSLYTGVKVNTWSLEVPVDGIVTTTFSVQGKQMSISGTSIDATPTAATQGEPFFHAGGTFSIDGGTDCNISSISLSVDNGGQPNYCLGDDTARDITTGFASISGAFTVYFDDAGIFTAFLNEATATLDFTLTDGVNTMQFELPAVKYSGADRTVEGQGPILVTANFEALAVAGKILTITRS